MGRHLQSSLELLPPILGKSLLIFTPFSFALDVFLGSRNFSELLLKLRRLHVPVRALLRLAPLLLGNPQAMVL